MDASSPLFDAHLHIIDSRFPLVTSDGFRPDPFSVDDYRSRTTDLDIVGGAVVSGSFQAFDQTYLLDALARLGSGFVGVTQLPDGVSDAEIISLAAAGVRGIRFNLRRGGSATVEHLGPLARRVHEVADWHTKLYVDSRDLPELAPLLVDLPAVSIDHLGLSHAGLPTLLRLVEQAVRVKATGFARGDLDVGATLRQIHAANPASLMVGTDLPSTRTRPFDDADLDLIRHSIDSADWPAVFAGNARSFYRILDRPKDRVFVVHGYEAAPDRHWFPWLTGQLEANGCTVDVVPLPDSESPSVRAWWETLAAEVGEVDAQTWFVGHSLGCITVLRYLAGLADPWSVAGIVLVAGFDGPLPSVPELDYFLADRLDASARRRIARTVPVRQMIRSDDDPFVPADASDALAAVIGAPVTVIPGAGHFTGSEGITELPLVRDLILGRAAMAGGCGSRQQPGAVHDNSTVDCRPRIW